MLTPPPPVDTPPTEGLGRLRSAISQAADLSGQVERGQAQMPLRDHFAGLAAALDSAPFTLALVGLDPESRSAALGWLCDAEFHVLTLDAPGVAGLVEVQLAERGYVLVKSGRRQEFDRLEPFLEAVRAADLIRNADADAWLEPLHLEVTAPRRVQGIRLLIPESAGVLAQNPTLAVRVRCQAMLLAVAGSTEVGPDDPAVAAVRELAAASTATWVIATGGPPPPGFFQRGWPSALGGGVFAPVHLGTGEGQPRPQFPEFLTDPRSGLRRGLVGCLQARRFESALEMLEDRVQQDVRQQNARRRALARRASALAEVGQDRPLRDAADAIRVHTAEALSGLETRLAESQRERLLPASRANNSITNLLEDLSADDVAQEIAGNVIKLSPAPASVKKAERAVREFLRGDLRDDIAAINAALEEVERDAAARPAPFGSGVPPVPAGRLDEAAVWETFGRAFHLDPHYRGELQHKVGFEGLLEWAMQGRRPVFLITMLSSMGLPLVTNLREQLAPVMVVIFAAGLYWSRRSFKEEQVHRLDREVERLRETLGAEVRRLYEQTLRDWQAFASRHLNEVVKRVARETDDRLKSYAADHGSRSARERAEVQDKLKMVDARLRELAALVQQVGRVRQAAADARAGQDRATRDALGQLQAAPRIP